MRRIPSNRMTYLRSGSCVLLISPVMMESSGESPKTNSMQRFCVQSVTPLVSDSMFSWYLWAYFSHALMPSLDECYPSTYRSLTHFAISSVKFFELIFLVHDFRWQKFCAFKWSDLDSHSGRAQLNFLSSSPSCLQLVLCLNWAELNKHLHMHSSGDKDVLFVLVTVSYPRWTFNWTF